MYCTDLESLKSELLNLERLTGARSVLLFAADKGHPERDDLVSVLKVFSKPLIGGIFPEIIADGERRESGFLVMPLCYDLKAVFHDLSLDVSTICDEINSHAETHRIENPGIFCFTDALAPNKTAMIDLLYDAWGPSANYVGGGAGSLSFKPFPCIIHGHTIAENAAVVGVMEASISVGVAHGWTPISKPIKVTEIDGNTVVSLNWEPAFDVYSRQIKSHSGIDISPENFFDIAKTYPLGLERLDSEKIIRDPYATDNGRLHIVDNVPEGEYIRIMNGNMDSLLEGAKIALMGAEINVGSDVAEQFCVDCISRVLYMQDEYDRELALLNNEKPMNGVLSIGEIANSGEKILELFNKTIVVAKWNRIN
jgi:hypothetical protein